MPRAKAEDETPARASERLHHRPARARRRQENGDGPPTAKWTNICGREEKKKNTNGTEADGEPLAETRRSDVTVGTAERPYSKRATARERADGEEHPGARTSSGLRGCGTDVIGATLGVLQDEESI